MKMILPLTSCIFCFSKFSELKTNRKNWLWFFLMVKKWGKNKPFDLPCNGKIAKKKKVAIFNKNILVIPIWTNILFIIFCYFIKRKRAVPLRLNKRSILYRSFWFSIHSLHHVDVCFFFKQHRWQKKKK